MKKRIVSLIGVCLTLTACSASNAGVTFDEGFQTFHYQGKDYAVSLEEVPEEDIRALEAKFLEYPVVRETGNTKETIALNSLYQTEDRTLAMGVQDSYYKVDLESQVSENQRLDYQGLLENTEE